MSQIKIISWNVNGIRAISKKGFYDWLHQEDPDILCIQETKAHPDQLSHEHISPNAYETFWESAQKKGYSGVALYTKYKPLYYSSLGDERFDSEGRVQIAHYKDFVLINCYFPNSQEKGRRLDYKLSFCQAILERCELLRKEGKHIVICGDYNIAHRAIDLKNPEGNEDSPGYLPEERQWMDLFTSTGYIDTFRLFESEGGFYTWWSYRTRARERNAGWRIDYHCVNKEFKGSVKGCKILNEVMGSDHCPVSLTLEVKT